MSDFNHPLKQADCEALNKILKSANGLREYWKTLDALGIDVSAQLDECEAQIKFCTDCKAKCFPNSQ